MAKLKLIFRIWHHCKQLFEEKKMNPQDLAGLSREELISLILKQQSSKNQQTEESPANKDKTKIDEIETVSDEAQLNLFAAVNDNPIEPSIAIKSEKDENGKLLLKVSRLISGGTVFLVSKKPVKSFSILIGQSKPITVSCGFVDFTKLEEKGITSLLASDYALCNTNGKAKAPNGSWCPMVAEVDDEAFTEKISQAFHLNIAAVFGLGMYVCVDKLRSVPLFPNMMPKQTSAVIGLFGTGDIIVTDIEYQ